MPELPEVDFARGQLARWLLGKRIVAMTAAAHTPLRHTTPAALRVLAGEKLHRIDRIGKHLLLHFSGGHGVYLHLGMTGKIVYRAKGQAPPRFDKVSFALARARRCTSAILRRFGRFQLLTEDAPVVPAPGARSSARTP